MIKDLPTTYVAATAVALIIGLYVLWGPSTTLRKRKRVPVIGLQNLGFTCFLNSLLQALASCPIFISWLECSQHGSVSNSLLVMLKILSSEADSTVEDPHSPTEMIATLRHNGWDISPGEQDAHELFHHLILTLEEESHKSNTNIFGCLSDALLPPVGPTSRPNIMTSKSFSIQNVSSHLNFLPSSSSTQITSKSNGNVPHIDPAGQGDLVPTSSKLDINRNPVPSPFTGFLTSQTNCTKCGFKSVLRYDKFDSLSLHLPPPEGSPKGHKLTQLLERFVKTEVVSGVNCDGCNQGVSQEGSPVLSTALKNLSIGKLPKCLCIHIPRTLIHESGRPYKREDYVDFPEFLAMDPYTQNSIMKDNRLKREKLIAELDKENNSTGETNVNIPTGKTVSNFKFSACNCNHMYRIKAVVVHKGTLEGGHFVTYRRGPLRSRTRHRSNQMNSHVEERWYLTSDADVVETTLCEALKATAYMLFYEKCSVTPS